MQTMSDLFDEGEMFVPQLVVAAEAFEAAVTILKAAIPEADKHTAVRGKVLICTVQGDIHDIGKNIVKTMLSASGLVFDLGRDVPTETVVEKAKELQVDIIAGAALMTTTMPSQRDIITILKEDGIRDQFKCMFGGAPVSPEWVEKDWRGRLCGNRFGSSDQSKGLNGRIGEVNRMAIAKKLTVFDVYERAKSGPKVDENDWDFKIIPQTAARLKKVWHQDGQGRPS